MGTKKSQVKKRWLLLGLIIVALLGAMIHVLAPFPRGESKTGILPSKFAIPVNTGFERQGKNQCAAFSTAFVLRYFGQNVRGAEVYAKIPYKVPISGYVLPKGIVTYFQSQGYSPAIYKGDLNSLKATLVQENKPVIVLVGNGLFWQHYMTFLGYDDEKSELYFFDSGRDKDENAGLTGNRTMTEDYFLKWWSNGLPVFNHVYLTMEKKG